MGIDQVHWTEVHTCIQYTLHQKLISQYVLPSSLSVRFLSSTVSFGILNTSYNHSPRITTGSHKPAF